jgi:hypothetical protein
MSNKTLFADNAELCAMITIRAIEITKAGKYHVFTEYAGHVDLFHVRVLRADQVYSDSVDHVRLYAGECYLNRDAAADQLRSMLATLGVFAQESAA